MDAIEVIDPISNQRLYSINQADKSEIDVVFSRATEGYQKLKQTSVKQRVKEVEKVIHYLLENQDRLLDRIVEETGRSRGDAMLSDMVQLVEDCYWLVQNAEKILADQKIATPLTLFGKKSRIYHEARGVVLVISPWNLPLAIALTAAMFAFVAGNAVIIKPSEQTPMKEIFQEICNISNVLKDALSVVQGGGETAQGLIAKRPDFIHFTGSVATGKKILSQSAQLIIPVCMELGAKDAMIVFEDADLDRAVAAACWGNMHNSGQSCTATERLFVHDLIYPEFVKRLKQEFLKIRMGTDADSDLGGLTTPAQMKIVSQQVIDAQSKGARVIVGGKQHQAYYQPTILADVTPEMDIAFQETFGPVLPVYSFKTEAEVITLHNHCEYGLSSSIWSSDPAKAERVARLLETGCVNINNVMLTEGNPGLPFGGVKQSGFGRSKGAEGLLSMTRSKAILIESAGKKYPEPNWYPYSREKLTLMKKLIQTTTMSNGFSKLIRLAKIGLKLDRMVKRLSRTKK